MVGYFLEMAKFAYKNFLNLHHLQGVRKFDTQISPLLNGVQYLIVKSCDLVDHLNNVYFGP